MKNLIFEKNSLVNGALALLIISFIAFGCACDDLEEDDAETERETAQNEQSGEPVPSKEMINEILQTTLMDIDEALETNDFAEFHSTLSTLWQKQSTPTTIKRLFLAVIKQKPNIQDTKSKDPIFMVKPYINDREFKQPTLYLKGYYPTSPKEIDFHFRYILDDGEWKLAGVDLWLYAEYTTEEKANKATQKDLATPSESELKELIDMDMVNLSDAIKKNDFGAFHETLAKRWKNQTTSKALQKALGNVLYFNDLSKTIGSKKPIFTVEPHLDRRSRGYNFLIVEGYYVISPQYELKFELKYEYEDGSWKLISIGAGEIRTQQKSGE